MYAQQGKLLAFGYCRFKGYMRSLWALGPYYDILLWNLDQERHDEEV